MIVAVAANARRGGDPARGLLAALHAGIVGALLIVVLVVVLSSYGPAGLIPDLVPAALTPADDLANSRIEIQDPYVALLFLSGLLAVALSAVSVMIRRPRPASADGLAAGEGGGVFGPEPDSDEVRGQV
jgi:hypothetical protein